MRLLIYAALFCCAFTAHAARAQTIERVVRVAPPRAGASRYVYVPFGVPRGARRVAVSYSYEREGGANTIDIGVFDARSSGSDTDPRGFRGWSGGRRSEFFITRYEATPGYLPGPLPAGTWHVILGLYKVAPSGVDVKLRLDIETGGITAGRPAARGSEILLPRETGRHRRTAGPNLFWLAGDMHMHTVHSDGDWTVHELAKAAYYSYLDFIFVTDHNTSSHHADVDRVGGIPRELLVLRGEEITTYGGHTNAWGLPAGAWVDFRVRPGNSSRMSEVAARAHSLGALVSVNHPFAACGGCDWSYAGALNDFDAIEVWNGEWDLTDERALKLWDGLLQRGLRPTAVASSDSHRAQNPIGRPTTHAAASELSQVALLRGIRGGRVYLTRGADGPAFDFEAAAGEVGPRGLSGPRHTFGEELRLRSPGTLVFFIRALGAPPRSVISLVSGGRVVRTFKAQSQLTEVFEVECERDAYYRLEVRDPAGAMLAMTNPIYVKVGGRR
ncbi:MAG TPA: CehA/McbA family metallohydrolase [Pyrinomonadaceae bacterium]|jgi:hypothetical protein|nr:CehA/McbA family metallohydrolase [Pyrinomonadaceae bacterium]